MGLGRMVDGEQSGGAASSARGVGKKQRDHSPQRQDHQLSVSGSTCNDLFGRFRSLDGSRPRKNSTCPVPWTLRRMPRRRPCRSAPCLHRVSLRPGNQPPPQHSFSATTNGATPSLIMHFNLTLNLEPHMQVRRLPVSFMRLLARIARLHSRKPAVLSALASEHDWSRCATAEPCSIVSGERAGKDFVPCSSPRTTPRSDSPAGQARA